jgi:hypothetical protein
MEKLIRKGATTYFIQRHQMEIQESKQDNSRAPEIQELIQKHKKVFQDLPMELPPQRFLNDKIFFISTVYDVQFLLFNFWDYNRLYYPLDILISDF